MLKTVTVFSPAEEAVKSQVNQLPFVLSYYATMSNNKVIYTCDVSDDGSDMDVSDNDDFVQAPPPPKAQPIPKRKVSIFIFYLKHIHKICACIYIYITNMFIIIRQVSLHQNLIRVWSPVFTAICNATHGLKTPFLPRRNRS